MSGRGEHTMGGNDEVCTPQEIFQPILDHFGPIGLDPCSNERSIVPAKVRYMRDLEEYDYKDEKGRWKKGYRDVEEPRDGQRHPEIKGAWYGDGLTQSWGGHGIVFVNSPWGKLRTKVGQQWITKGYEEADECFHLTKAAVSTQWWQRLMVLEMHATTCYEGRITFLGSVDPAPFACAMSYYGPRLNLFFDIFEKLGWTVEH